MKQYIFTILLVGLTTASRAAQPESPTTLPEAPASSRGFDPDRLKRIDAAVDRAIAEKQGPGRGGDRRPAGAIVYARAAGRRAVEPAAEPMTRDTIFDMASLTKPVATATSVMLLVEEGRVKLEDRVVKYLPELDNHGKGEITVEHLLRHRAGLIPDNPLKDYADGPRSRLEADRRDRPDRARRASGSSTRTSAS